MAACPPACMPICLSAWLPGWLVGWLRRRPGLIGPQLAPRFVASPTMRSVSALRVKRLHRILPCRSAVHDSGLTNTTSTTFAVFSGLAVGYADETAEVNTLRSERAGLEEWARFLGSWDEQGMVTLDIFFIEICFFLISIIIS